MFKDMDLSTEVMSSYSTHLRSTGGNNNISRNYASKQHYMETDVQVLTAEYLVRLSTISKSHHTCFFDFTQGTIRNLL